VNATRPPGRNTLRFTQRPDRAGDVVDPEIRHDRVERPIVEGQHLRVALFEPETGMGAARQSEHRRGKIEPHRKCPTSGERSRDRPRPAGEVEHAHSRSDTSGVEQLVDETLGCPGERRGVLRCRALPAGILKIADSLRIKSHGNSDTAGVLRSRFSLVFPVEGFAVSL
jgi:hypothetical protein